MKSLLVHLIVLVVIILHSGVVCEEPTRDGCVNSLATPCAYVNSLHYFNAAVNLLHTATSVDLRNSIFDKLNVDRSGALRSKDGQFGVTVYESATGKVVVDPDVTKLNTLMPNSTMDILDSASDIEGTWIQTVLAYDPMNTLAQKMVLAGTGYVVFISYGHSIILPIITCPGKSASLCNFYNAAASSGALINVLVPSVDEEHFNQLVNMINSQRSKQYFIDANAHVIMFEYDTGNLIVDPQSPGTVLDQSVFATLKGAVDVAQHTWVVYRPKDKLPRVALVSKITVQGKQYVVAGTFGTESLEAQICKNDGYLRPCSLNNANRVIGNLMVDLLSASTKEQFDATLLKVSTDTTGRYKTEGISPTVVDINTRERRADGDSSKVRYRVDIQKFKALELASQAPYGSGVAEFIDPVTMKRKRVLVLPFTRFGSSFYISADVNAEVQAKSKEKKEKNLGGYITAVTILSIIVALLILSLVVAGLLVAYLFVGKGTNRANSSELKESFMQ